MTDRIRITAALIALGHIALGTYVTGAPWSAGLSLPWGAAT